jgi:hypothetical protein
MVEDAISRATRFQRLIKVCNHVTRASLNPAKENFILVGVLVTVLTNFWVFGVLLVAESFGFGLS